MGDAGSSADLEGDSQGCTHEDVTGFVCPCGWFDAVGALNRIFDLELELERLDPAPRMQRLRDKGWTQADIAAALGTTQQQVSRLTTGGVGITWEMRGKLAVAREALDDGMSLRDAAEIAGLSEETVRRRFPGQGWTPQQVGVVSQLTQRLNKL